MGFTYEMFAAVEISKKKFDELKKECVAVPLRDDDPINSWYYEHYWFWYQPDDYWWLIQEDHSNGVSYQVGMNVHACKAVEQFTLNAVMESVSDAAKDLSALTGEYVKPEEVLLNYTCQETPKFDVPFNWKKWREEVNA